MEKIQLSSAQRTKMPSERQMTQALQATRLGVALHSGLHPRPSGWRDTNPAQTAIRAAMRSNCSRMRVKGAGRKWGRGACSTALRPSPDAMAQTTASNGPEPQGDLLYLGLEGRSRQRQLLPGLHRIAERKGRKDSGANTGRDAGRPGSRGWPPRECRSPNARAAPIPTGWDVSSKRRRSAAETAFRARRYLTTMRMRCCRESLSNLDSHEPT